MHDLEALVIFVRVAEMASFTRAAQRLGIQKARASTVIRQLEKEVGARLLHRTTRSVQLTEDGRVFQARAQALLGESEDLWSMFAERGARLRGRLRVDLPTELARTTIVPALPGFMAAHPDLNLEISSTDRRVDLVGEGIDCALRLGPLVDETLIARRLGALRMINAASPTYLELHGTPRTLADLTAQGHRIVHYAPVLGAKPSGWEYPDRKGYASLALAGSLAVDSVQTYHAAGLAGLGLIQAALSGLAAFLARGELIEILPELRPEALPAALVVAHRTNLSRRVRVFMAWLEKTLAPYLDAV